MTRIWTIDNRMGGPMENHKWRPFTTRDGSIACSQCRATQHDPIHAVTTAEIVYTWPDGREEVRYRRVVGTPECEEMEHEVSRLRAMHGTESPYRIRYV